jgi:DNA modification methylase
MKNSKSKNQDAVKKYKNKIIFKDCINGMTDLPSNSADVVLADPPYNLSKGNSWKWDNSVELPGMGGDWKKVMEDWDDMSFSDYWKFTTLWLSEVQRIVKPTGSIWICGTYHNIGIINTILQLLSIEIINEVIWYKRNAFPNLSGRRFTASHENLLWCHIGKKRDYYFDYHSVKAMEFSNDLMKKKGKQMRTVWDIPNNKPSEETKHGKVISQKPVALFERILNATSKKNQVCLIPFCGSGTECIAAIRTKRNFIAFENNKEHYNIASKRIRDELK